MADNQKNELNEDIKVIKNLTSKMDYSNQAMTGKILAGLRAKQMLNSPIGVKYKAKLEGLSQGLDDKKCLICNGVTNKNAIFCDTCFAKVYGNQPSGVSSAAMKPVQTAEHKKVEKDVATTSIVAEKPSVQQKKAESTELTDVKKSKPAKKKKKKSVGIIILLCFIGFALIAGAKEAITGDYSESGSATQAVKSEDVSEETVREEKPASKDKSKDKSKKTVKRSGIHFSASFVVTSFIVLLILAYLYMNYYMKEYEKETGTNCGGLLDYRWSIAESVAIILAFLSRPRGELNIKGVIFFLICVLVIAFCEYAIYTDVRDNTGNESLAKKALVAQFSASFLIAVVVVAILLIISSIMNSLNKEKEKMSEKDKNFLKTALYSVAIFSLMEQLEEKVKE